MNKMDSIDVIIIAQRERNKILGKLYKRLKAIKKMPMGLLGMGGCLCPSNPKYYEIGFSDAIKEIKKGIK